MLVLVKANVLTVGLEGRSKVLKELPIRLIDMRSGVEAARSLKNEKVDSVISTWDLEDMPDGQFVRNLRAVKPDIPTIVFITSGDSGQEIEARSLGVSAVLTDQADDELLKRTLMNVLGLSSVDAAIESIAAVKHSRSQ